MSPETVESIKEALTPLMEKLGQGGDAAWAMAVRQQYVVAGQAVVLWILLLAMGGVWWRRIEPPMQKWVDAGSSYSDRDMARTVARIVFAAVFFFLGVASVVSTVQGVSRLINPEWYALQSLLNLVTGQ